MDFRGAHSRSADGAQSATRNRPGLRAVRDEAKLPKHHESVPIPAKVLDLPIPCDADERGEQSLGDLSTGLTVHRAYRHLWPNRRDQREKTRPLLRSDSGTKLRGPTY